MLGQLVQPNVSIQSISENISKTHSFLGGRMSIYMWNEGNGQSSFVLSIYADEFSC